MAMPEGSTTIDVVMAMRILYSVVGLMVMVVLYHLIIILVDVRKIVRRFEDMTEQVEMVLLKPLTIADQVFAWVLDWMDQKQKKTAHHKHDEKHHEKHPAKK
jgi:hypothetical protein